MGVLEKFVHDLNKGAKLYLICPSMFFSEASVLGYLTSDRIIVELDGVDIWPAVNYFFGHSSGFLGQKTPFVCPKFVPNLVSPVLEPNIKSLPR